MAKCKVSRQRRSPARDSATNADPLLVVVAPAELDENELHALIATTNGVPQTAPTLLVWLECALERPL